MNSREVTILENFYKEYIKGRAEYVGFKTIGYIFSFISLIFMMMPVQTWDGDVGLLYISTVFASVGAAMLISAYNKYSDQGKDKNINDILEFLPISKKTIYMFRLKKSLRIGAVLGGIALFSQIVFTFAAFHKLSVYNIAGVLVYTLVPIILVNIGLFKWNLRKILTNKL